MREQCFLIEQIDALLDVLQANEEGRSNKAEGGRRKEEDKEEGRSKEASRQRKKEKCDRKE